MVAEMRQLQPITPVTARPTLVYAPHPLLAAANRQIRYEPFEPGETIAVYLARTDIRLGNRPVALCLNDRFIPRSEWALTIPRAGDLLTIRALVQDGGGGGGGGSDPVRTVLTIAVMVVAPYLAGPAGLGFQVGTLAYSAATAAIALGGMLLVNTLVPPPRPQLSQAARRLDNPSPTYALSGGSNRARPYEPLPIVMGQYRHFPDYGAKEYTEFAGEDQYLYQVFNFGLSDLVLSDFRIGATPIANYSDVEIQESGADGKLTLFPANVDTASGGALTYAAGWITRTSSTDATALAVDIAGSLYYAGQDGISARSVTIEIEYRAVGAGTWLPFVGAASAVTLTSDSRKPLRRTYRLTVAQGQYEVRVRRTTADDTDAQAVSDLSWSQLRTYQPDLADYTGQKRVAVRIKASGQLQGQIAEFNALASARCPVWNGASWVTQATSNPAWWCLWWLRGKRIGGRRVFGGDLPDSRIDIDGLKEFGAWCASKNLTFNGVFDGVMNCAEVLVTVARCGRGAPSFATGKHGVIWDAPNKPAVQTFGMGNIKRNSFRVEYVSEKLADEIVVKFTNPQLVGASGNWQQDKVRCPVPGVANPERPSEIELFGCTDKDMAGREGNLLAAAQKYLKRHISWESDFEGMVAQRGDVAYLSHDLTQWGYSGRVVAGNGTSLTLDRKVPFTPAQAHYVGITFPNGYYDILAVTYQAGESDTIALAEAWPTQDDLGNPLYTPSSDPNHPPYDYKFVFDPKATPGKKVKITGVKPLTEHYVRLEATDEEADYYLQETNQYTYVTPGTYGDALPAISNLQATETLVRAGAVWNVLLTLTWDAAGPYGGAIVRAGLNGEPLAEKGRTFERRYDITVPDTGSITVEVTLFNPSGRYSDVGKATLTHTIVGDDFDPVDVTGFTVQQNGDLCVFRCDAATQQHVLEAEIRYNPQGNKDWDSATPAGKILKGLVFTSAAVPPGAKTFLAKYKSTSERYSQKAATFDLDVVNTFDEVQSAEQAPDWRGMCASFIRHPSGVLIRDSSKPANQHTRAELFEKFVPYPQSECNYETPAFDLGFDAEDVRVWADTESRLGRGVTEGVADPQLQIDYRKEADAYDGFEPWSIGTANFRRLKARLSVNGTDAIVVSSFKPVCDVKEYSVSVKDIAVPAGGMTVTFPQRFHFPPHVNPSALSSGGAARYANASSVTETGFHLDIFDATGANVGGTGGYDATGV